MMKKTMKQLLGIGLSAAMVLSMAACGNDTPANTTEESKTSEASVVSSEIETATSEEDAAPTYPLDTDLSISLWTSTIRLNSDYTDASQSPYHTGLAERTGVEIEWMFPLAGENANAAFNLLLTEKVLPDVIYRQSNIGELNALYEDGLIYDLTEYLPKYAPDYWAVLNSEEYGNVYQDLVTGDGKILGFASISESDMNKTYIGPVIRQDWLDECGLKAPVTLEDWENVLRTFKDKYGATLSTAGVTYLSFLGNMTGAQGGFNERYYIEDGKVKYANDEEETFEFIALMAKWFEEGLIDNDLTSLDANALRTKAANGKVGISCIPMSQMTNWINDAEASGSGANWVGLSYPRTEVGATVEFGNGAYSNWAGNTVAVVTTSCPEEDLVEVLQFLNYGYTEEGIMYNNFGEEGKTYTVDAKGEIQWTDLFLNDEQGVNGAAQKYTAASASPIGVHSTDFVLKKNHETTVAALEIWLDNNDACKYYMPSLSYTTEEQEAKTNISGATATFVKEWSSTILKGEKKLTDEEKAYFKSELEKMGKTELLEIHQAAYDRYLAK